MEPTTAEVIFWSVIGVVMLLLTLYGLIINPHYDPKSEDPYRYCPKEEE